MAPDPEQPQAPSPAGRLGLPGRFGLAPPYDLHDYGLIGNLHTSALLSRFGSIDWACFPRFASPSVFARLIDPGRGGFQLLAPAEPYTSSQRYLPATNLLETRFDLDDDRVLRVTDFMPILPGRRGEGLPLIVRELEAEGGAVSTCAVLHAAFDYARVVPRVHVARDGFHLEGADHHLSYRVPPGSAPEGELVVGSFEVRPGETRVVEIVGEEHLPSWPSAMQLRATTEAFWKKWMEHHPRPVPAVLGGWHPWVDRSMLVLKLLSHADTGAFVAAPTTSLPEWPGGPRNWDYRYAWVRDAAFTAEALLRYGHPEEARSYLRWVLGRVHRKKGARLGVVYGVHGETELTEEELGHLDGFRGSRPVRIGNGAAEQFQLDIYGELIEAADHLAEFDPGFVQGLWPRLAGLADEVCHLWREPDRGIWEVRGPPAHYVHSKLMAWVALDRAAGLGRRFGAPRSTAWSAEAERVRDELLLRGVDQRTGTFVQAFGRSVPDAANLRIPMVRFLPYSDPRVIATVEEVERKLARGPFVRRYLAEDGLTGPEGAFLPCSFWLVECLARVGRTEAARDRWETLLAASGPLKLFSEEHDAESNMALGNYPQAFTHIGLLRAARALSEPVGTAGGPPTGQG